MHPLVQQPLSPRARGHSMVNPGSPSARFVASSGDTSDAGQLADVSGFHTSSCHFITRYPATRVGIAALNTKRAVEASKHWSWTINNACLPRTKSYDTPFFIHFRPWLSRRAECLHGPSTTCLRGPIRPISPVHDNGIPQSRHPCSVRASYERDNRRPLPGPGNSSLPEAPGMIPCFVDLKSGSSSQAEKRKANSDASRRFRNRKRNEMQLEARLTAQQDEIRALLQQRDHYRSERDFFREQLSRSVPLSNYHPGRLRRELHLRRSSWARRAIRRLPRSGRARR
ncbi:hypothetical protein N7470_010385 [Penicillium chermesinum]|nr:hypothetical protein N7470_010385 [Penicillium chermesinum]